MDPFNNAETIPRLFSYHPATPNQIPRYEALRAGAREFAELIQAHCPSSAERTLAIRYVATAVMHANQAIAVNEATTISGTGYTPRPGGDLTPPVPPAVIDAAKGLFPSPSTMPPVPPSASPASGPMPGQ